MAGMLAGLIVALCVGLGVGLVMRFVWLMLIRLVGKLFPPKHQIGKVN
jgi:predicted tellurium resistance membrane protein TerC